MAQPVTSGGTYLAFRHREAASLMRPPLFLKQIEEATAGLDGMKYGLAGRIDVRAFGLRFKMEDEV